MCIHGSMINILTHTQGYIFHGSDAYMNIITINRFPAVDINAKNWQFWAFAFPVILRHTCTHICGCLTDCHLSFVLFKVCIPFALIWFIGFLSMNREWAGTVMWGVRISIAYTTSTQNTDILLDGYLMQSLG